MFYIDTSPISSSPLHAQATQWHGNVDTSTDTLVPVDDRISCEITSSLIATKGNESTAYENGIEVTGDSSRSSSHQHQQLLSEISVLKSKALPTCGIQSAMDESIFIQPEQQRMEICNGNRSDVSQSCNTASVPNGTTANVSSMSLYRRRRNSFNSKPSPNIADVTTVTVTQSHRSNSISPNTMNLTKFFQQNPSRSPQSAAQLSTQMRTLQSIQTQPAPANLSSIACPDGLAHTLSEENLRLQQIMHEHKVS